MYNRVSYVHHNTNAQLDVYGTSLVAYRKGLGSNPTGAAEFLVYIFYFY